MFMYLHTKFQVFNIILMSSRQGVSSGGEGDNFTHETDP